MKITLSPPIPRGDEKTAPGRRAFTLIELLVVIGLISILAAGIGLSMRDGNPTSALKAGQNAVVGLLSAARGQAALTQSNAMIVVDVTDLANDPNEYCLRALQVVVQADDAGTEWRPVGEPVLLPANIYVVPPSGAGINGVNLVGNGWSAQRSSAGFETSEVQLQERDYAADYPYYPTGAFNNRSYLKFRVFTPLGTMITPAGATGQGTLLVTTGKRGAAQISLDNPQMLRGVTVSRYGVPTLINEAETFDVIQ
jgi:prepilin-type N-terminal cleavage/methylation domain-containing protein